MPQPFPATGRTPEQLRAHYDIETELASRLRNASKDERRELYCTVYDELFQRVPDHPQLRRKATPEMRADVARREWRFLSRFLSADSAFLELGPGDCAVCLEVAHHVRTVYAIDVSDQISRTENAPKNFNLFVCDACAAPIPPDSVDVAFSNQLMEHLHPDDADEQLAVVYAALSPGGRYICATPNRLCGPHDISRYFDDVATGFHLREYTAREVRDLFAAAGFSRVLAYVGARGVFVRWPMTFVVLGERVLESLPEKPGRRLAHTALVSQALNAVRIVGVK